MAKTYLKPEYTLRFTLWFGKKWNGKKNIIVWRAVENMKYEVPSHKLRGMYLDEDISSKSPMYKQLKEVLGNPDFFDEVDFFRVSHTSLTRSEAL